MKLNHLNLCVDNLSKAHLFFHNCFDFQFVEQKGKALLVMTDGNGFTLVLMNPQAFGNEMRPYPEGFHIGFLQETKDQVDEIYNRLVAIEIHPADKPGKMRGATYGFYVTALNNILFEVSSPL